MRSERVFSELVTSNRMMLYAFAFSICRSHHDAEAILQEAIIIAWQKMDEFDAGTPFGKWTRAIVYRVAMNHYRAGQRRPVLCDEETLSALSDAFNNVERDTGSQGLLEALDTCIKKLSEKNSRVLRMRYFDRMKVSEMAKVLRRSVSAIDVMVFRLRKRLEKCIRVEWRQEDHAG